MLAEVLLASLVLLVPCLIVADVTLRQSNTVYEQTAETAAGSGSTVDMRAGVNRTAALLRKIFHLGPENLGVRPSLLLLVGIPTVVAVALGGLRIASSGIVDGAVVLVVLVLVLVSTVIIGSSLLRRLRNLRAGALQVADVRLPEAVRRISETGGEDVSLDVEPLDVDSPDEIGDVARAFDQVHREALRLAADEARVRGNINAMFVNLSRRSQALVERLIKHIDDLEQGEQDAERLGNLFHMDHLATRMRRNSENLLVLAGHDLSSNMNEPVTLVDVLRAAVSEIEEYERVSLMADPNVAVRGAAVNDVVHLLAELAENATSLSPPGTPVTIAGRQMVTSGQVLISVSDQGVGMSDVEMARANQQLEKSPVVDVVASRRMGLFVVGRLAARHGIRVQLRPAISGGGLTAMVLLPNEVIAYQDPAAWMRPHSFGTPEPRAAMFETDSAALPRTGPGYHAGWVAPGRAIVQHEVSTAGTGEVAPSVRDAEDPPPGPWHAPAGPGGWPGAARGATSRTEMPQPGMVPPAGARESSVPGAWPGENYKETAAGGGSAANTWDRGSAQDGVTVPPTQNPADRLPIFEAVGSDWFQRDQGTSGAPDGVGNTADSWVSRADEGWHAAEKVPMPSSGGLTPGGLPRRLPGANLVPGAAASTPAPPPNRSAAAARERFASFQQGVREGRTAASSGTDPDGDDETL
jgi:signal transduction histidine kinase